jgi:hypothetical protein
MQVWNFGFQGVWFVSFGLPTAEPMAALSKHFVEYSSIAVKYSNIVVKSIAVKL